MHNIITAARENSQQMNKQLNAIIIDGAYPPPMTWTFDHHQKCSLNLDIDICRGNRLRSVVASSFPFPSPRQPFSLLFHDQLCRDKSLPPYAIFESSRDIRDDEFQ